MALVMVGWTLKLDIEIFKLAVVTLALFILYKYRRIFEMTLPALLLKRGAVVVFIFWLGFLVDVMNDVYPTPFTKILDDIIISFALILGTYYIIDYMNKSRLSVVPSKVANGESALAKGAYIVTKDIDISKIIELAKGEKIIALTRNPELFKKQGISYLWLSKVPGENAIDPLRLPAILHKLIESADKDTIVIIDGLEYLTLENGFNSVLKFLTTLKDNLLLKGATLLLVLDPKTLEHHQAALLKKEFKSIEQ
ncbi:DUF835 domain-containing protein [Thermococcus stetteri]|uniref:DUF835 domain-containing protein n=1 Tax=Thermococcus stetteri TaxID=49900 RepID=UPI001FD86F56|nr:DUF835 domain-containing protein [Thermococcus stetteri]MBP1911635.1 hypothetical protein [Thermococcus stetteri]